ncbi:MAG: restriction endonuclease subunit S [Verrucomicrobia bacterium]|nr:restriction endonuclease subunit S [Verrucomicrobiota bacterium]
MSDELPNGWATAPLSELLTTLESGSRPRGGVRGIADGVPSIGGEHLNYTGGFNFDSVKYVPKDFAAAMSKGRIQRHDILVVKDGATTGKTAFVDSRFPYDEAFVNEHVFICRPRKEIEPQFLFRFLTSMDGQKRILENFKGSAQGGINQTFAPNTEVPLAPLTEQRRIVAKLETLLGKVDASQQRLAKIPVLLKRFRHSVLAAACSGRLTADWREERTTDCTDDTDKKPSVKSAKSVVKNWVSEDLPELPETWSWVALGDYSRCFRGRFTPRPRNDPRYFGGKHPFIQIGNLPREGGFVTSHTQTLNDEGLAVSRKFPKGTVVIAIVGATIGNTGVLAYDMCVTDSIVGLETGDELGNRYVELFLRHKKDDIRQTSYSSGGQPNINLAALNPYPLALPPLPEQQEIVRRVEGLFALADQLEERLAKARGQVAKLTPSLLARAFAGKLVPQDPNDEPAADLLKRLKQSA